MNLVLNFIYYRTFGTISFYYLWFMRPQKVDDEALLNSLFAVLRAKGYNGSTLNDFAKASGLQKPSLYHRFPGGKEEISSCVLNFVHQWIEQNIYDLLMDKTIPTNHRLKSVIKNINAVYNDGDSICLLRALSMDAGIKVFGAQIKDGMGLWIKGFTNLGEDCGHPKNVAKAMAYQVLINIQGSLVVSKGLGSTGPFKAALRSIKAMYL